MLIAQLTKYLILFLFVLYCPKGHMVYYLEEEPVECQVITASMFDTNNRGNLFKGIYTPISYGNPINGMPAICPICNTTLCFTTQYIKEIK